jgi:hypothetical protein
LALVLSLAVPFGLALADDRPPQKTPGKGIHHPNLSSAHKLTLQAFAKLEAAQQANEYDLGGHAAKAKALLKQAGEEIKLATQAAQNR